LAVPFILSSLGYNISALLAGLGIGGIAVAFALQTILADIFASFSIYFDKPFRVGDYIVVGNDRGTVKHIGIKTTRIKSLEGPELVISNKELTSSRIHNYKKMEKRRISFTIGIVYETPLEKVKKAKEIIENVIKDQKMAELDRVHFARFGDFSLEFEIVYYMLSTDYKDYMDTQEKINLKIKEEFEKEGIEFAYPTQKIYLGKDSSNQAVL
jgi:small-conductance mechanosensitive channel